MIEKLIGLWLPNCKEVKEMEAQNKKRSPKNAELVLRCNNGGFPRYVLNQLKIFVPVGKDIKIVTPVK